MLPPTWHNDVSEPRVAAALVVSHRRLPCTAWTGRQAGDESAVANPGSRSVRCGPANHLREEGHGQPVGVAALTGAGPLVQASSPLAPAYQLAALGESPNQLRRRASRVHKTCSAE